MRQTLFVEFITCNNIKYRLKPFPRSIGIEKLWVWTIDFVKSTDLKHKTKTMINQTTTPPPKYKKVKKKKIEKRNKTVCL